MGIEESWLSVLLLGSHVLLGGLNLLIVLTQTQILAFFALELKMSSYSDVPLLTFALSSKFSSQGGIAWIPVKQEAIPPVSPL